MVNKIATASESLKKADRVANFSIWLFFIFIANLLVNLAFHVATEISIVVSFGLVSVGWLIKIIEARYLRSALKSSV